eukprot:1625135-Heterocapsa_arctica.AAC.1
MVNIEKRQEVLTGGPGAVQIVLPEESAAVREAKLEQALLHNTELQRQLETQVEGREKSRAEQHAEEKERLLRDSIAAAEQ